MRRSAMTAAVALFCLPLAAAAAGQYRQQAQRSAPARQSAPAPQQHQQPSRQQPPKSNPQAQGRRQAAPQHSTPAPSSFGNGFVNTRPRYTGPPSLGPAFSRPGYPGSHTPSNAPPGHLESWLDAHRNVPVQNQEQMLRKDPSFQRLVPGEQQRLLQQLRDVNQLSEQRRERRLARNENLERLSPMARMQVSRSAHEWTQLPPERQAMMRSAFRDLRSVPPDQRGTVLSSQHYQSQFTPQERGILSELLRVEPYDPPRQ